MSRLKRWWPILILALAPLLPLRRAVLAGETPGPFDQIQQMAPWNRPAPTQAWDVLQADGVLQFYAWRDLVFESWGKGQLPLWNHYQLCGTPLAANSQSAAFYPPHILCGALRIPTPAALSLLAWLHLFWAGLGVFVLAKRLGASEFGATVGGLCFCLSTLMLSWVALPSVISTAAWIPWVLAGVWATGQLGNQATGQLGGGGRERVPLARLAGLAVSVAMLLLAGHLQFAAFGLMAAGFLAAWLFVAAFIGRRREGDGTAAEAPSLKPQSPFVGLLLTIAALAVGAMLAAPQLLPVLQYSKTSHRAGAATAEGYDAYAASALKPFELAGFVFPNLLGDPTAKVPDLGASAYWPQFVKQGSNAAETAVSLGPVVVLLLCFLPWRRWRTASPVVGIGLLGLLIACGTPLTRFLYFCVPGWSATGSPGRAGVLVVLAGCVAAALAFAPPEPSVDRKRFAPLLVFGLAVALSVMAVRACAGLTPAFPQLEQAWPAIFEVATSDAVKLALVAALLCAGASWAWIKVPNGRWAVLALAVAVPSGLGWNAVRTGVPQFACESESFERKAFVNDGWGMAVAEKGLMPPNTAAIQRVHDVAGYDSLLHRDTVGLLRQIDGADPAPPVNGNMMLIKPSADPRRLAEAGVTEVWSLQPLPQLGSERELVDGTFRYVISGPGRTSTPAGPSTVVEEGFDRLKLQAVGPGKLVLRDRRMPGWAVSVDGKPAEDRGTVFHEVELSAGPHDVLFTYDPPGMKIGFALAAVAVVVLVVAGGIAAWGVRAGRNTA